MSKGHGGGCKGGGKKGGGGGHKGSSGGHKGPSGGSRPSAPHRAPANHGPGPSRPSAHKPAHHIQPHRAPSHSPSHPHHIPQRPSHLAPMHNHQHHNLSNHFLNPHRSHSNSHFTNHPCQEGFGRRNHSHSPTTHFPMRPKNVICYDKFRHHHLPNRSRRNNRSSIPYRRLGPTYEQIIYNPSVQIHEGGYIFSGGQGFAQENLDSFASFYQQEQQKLNPEVFESSIPEQLEEGQDPKQVPVPVQLPLNQASFEIVGDRLNQDDDDDCCYISTIVFGICLIFPFFFMCCNWWKKIVYPLYYVNHSTYTSIGNFLSAAPKVTKLTIEVVDNCFNSQKAQILHEALKDKPLTSFTFVNSAIPINYSSQDEYDQFQVNVFPIKQLPFETNLMWDEKVL